MNFSVPIFVLFGLVVELYPGELNNESRVALPVDLISNEDNGSDGVGVIKSGLSTKSLFELHHLAKNISRSKSIFRESNSKTDGEKEVRRSITRKATIAVESDTIKSILKIFDTAENKEELLESLEFMVHQYDVAISFATMGGMKIIAPHLFSSNDEIVSSVARVLGAAMQSNPPVQNLAMEQYIDKYLIMLLSRNTSTVVSRCIFALSSLLRNFPKAQEGFFLAGGITKLSNMLESPVHATKIKLKIIDLVTDLAVELQQPSEEYSKDKRAALQRLFAGEVQQYGFCTFVTFLLDLEDYDTHQKLVSSMISLESICRDDFDAEYVKRRVLQLITIYKGIPYGKDPWYPAIDADLRNDFIIDLQQLFWKISKEPPTTTISYAKKNEL